MPAQQYFKIEGLEELNTLVTNLSPELTTQFHGITGKYAQSMSGEMRNRCPVKTGYLRSTIGASSSPDSMEVFVTASYAGYVNFGTSRMKARPFYSSVVEEQTPQMVEELSTSIATYLSKNVVK